MSRSLVPLLLIGCGAMTASAETFESGVREVPSGDIVVVERGGEALPVRLFGIAAPESAQPFHDAARDLLREKTEGVTVSVTLLAEDNLGTAVGEAHLPDGASLSEVMLDAGLAWWDQENAPAFRAARTLNARAIVGKRGIWSEGGAPLAPWDHRRSEGLERIRYDATAPAAEPAPMPEPAAEEPPRLAARGEATEGVRFDISELEDVGDLNPMALIARHPPEFPRDEDGNVLGLRVPNVSQIPFATQLGFRDGDILQSVNNMPINTSDINALMALAPQFRNQKRFNVTVLRGGQPVNWTIDIP